MELGNLPLVKYASDSSSVNFIMVIKVRQPDSRIYACVSPRGNQSGHKIRNRGSYMSAHVLLNLLNGLGKRDKMRCLSSILSLFRNQLIHEHEC